MKRILFFVGVGFSPVVPAQAQQVNPAMGQLGFYQQPEMPVVKKQGSPRNMEIPNMRLASDSTRYLLYEAGKLSPTLIHLLMPSGFNTVKIDYGAHRGKFAAAQDATADRTFTFSTEGKTTLGKTDLWGAFNYQRIVEDSTRFRHQTRNNPTAPYYFGSPAAVSYHRTLYQTKVGLSHTFLNNHLPLGVGVDYRIGNHFSVNDPRGAINDYQFTMNAGTGYSLGNKFRGTVDGYYGYGAEVVNVAYKNVNYGDNTVYPDYVTYLINGYAEPNPKLSNRNYRTRFRRSGAGFSLIYRNKTSGIFAATAKRIKEKQFYYYRSDGGFDTLSNYTLTTTKANLLWSRRRFAASFAYEALKGEDLHETYNANNYQYRSKSYTLRAVYTGRRMNYGVLLNNNSEERMDGITGNHMQYGHITVQPNIGWNYTTKNKDHWGTDLALHYTGSVHPTLYTTSVNVNYFTHQVIQYDYYLNAASSAGGTFSLQYNKHFKGFYAGLKGTIAYTEAFDESKQLLEGAMKPGKDRAYGNISLQFYF
ncbi:DUF6850 family outer membrane beta-barrel protein [Chitinophaga sancti]|uniref:DUF6850 family outer membrane beta-barrel protein n=1 Tax=Chitinophaga sancti TaxID=1004 RepID=UPI003F79C7C0